MKILIIRFSSIGDLVLTTPVIRCLKQQLSAEIHFLVKEQYISILNANPYIDQVIGLRNNLRSLTRELKKIDYDYIVDLHKNLRTAYFSLRLRMKTLRVHKLNVKKWLLTKFKVNWLPRKHLVDRYLQTVKPLGVYNDGRGLDFFIPQKDQINVTHLHSSLLPNQYISFVVGAAHATKQLPSSKIISICRKINYPIVLIGGAKDSENGKKIKNLSGPHVVNLCGVLNLQQSADVIRQSRKVITPDTGMMHISAALNKEIISVWGSTVPELGMYPYYPENRVAKNTMVQVSGLSCRPCSKIGYSKCPRGHFKCMELIREAAILAQIPPPLTSNP